MKREFLEGLDLGDGVKLPKSAVDAIMAENGKDIEAQKSTITTLTTERDGLRTQLDEANQSIQSYKDMDIDGVKQSVKDWETKYNADTQKLKDDLAAVKYGHAVEKAVGGLKFTSESARKAFVADLTGKKLPLQDDGTLLGLEDFTKTYREADPGAFAADGGGKRVVATRPTEGANGGTAAPASMRDAIAAALNAQNKT